MKANDILEAVVRQRFPPQRFTVCPNVTCFCYGESDVIAISEAGYINEVEIKVSAADLRRDAKKYRWRHDVKQDVHYYWLAVPEELTYAALSRAHDIGGAGVIRCAPGRGGVVAEVEERPQRWPGPSEEKFPNPAMTVARLAMLRYWDMKFPKVKW